ncbi:MAG: hypothetical protein HONBIEJF_00719 [Fimbriimonadaceae bacterium]|nr:hypothetical protein [Fimbriimonadaceae bacterium]
MKGKLVLAIVTVACAANAHIDTGHMIISEMAWRGLTPAAKRQAVELLRSAPEPEYRDHRAAACWADDTKTRENGPWHYINLPFRKGDTSNSFSGGEQHVVWAIRKLSGVLSDRKQPTLARREALNYLLHFVGDVHQPLHGTSRPSQAWPSGDRGGNEYKIRTPEGTSFEVRNLHFLWDIACCGYGETQRPLTEAGKLTIAGQANAILREFPRKSINNLGDTDPMAWARESRDLAVDFVYSTPENDVPGREYLKRGREISRRRMATAAYRLADLLNRTLK